MANFNFPLISNDAATPLDNSMIPSMWLGTKDKQCLAVKTAFP